MEQLRQQLTASNSTAETIPYSERWNYLYDAQLQLMGQVIQRLTSMAQLIQHVTANHETTDTARQRMMARLIQRPSARDGTTDATPDS